MPPRSWSWIGRQEDGHRDDWPGRWMTGSRLDLGAVRLVSRRQHQSLAQMPLRFIDREPGGSVASSIRSTGLAKVHRVEVSPVDHRRRREAGPNDAAREARADSRRRSLAMPRDRTTPAPSTPSGKPPIDRTSTIVPGPPSPAAKRRVAPSHGRRRNPSVSARIRSVGSPLCTHSVTRQKPWIACSRGIPGAWSHADRSSAR